MGSKGARQFYDAPAPQYYYDPVSVGGHGAATPRHELVELGNDERGTIYEQAKPRGHFRFRFIGAEDRGGSAPRLRGFGSRVARGLTGASPLELG
jgi:hypothetical protein